ncbi:ANK1 [Symbiodinium pilosum]|uniref:ANK1 protein n=1 Tax=Symbiodinium pilosum TaxID=2952 RepID=A0A812SKH6_SYMPI|nr:ANK1 [Symbiodinium pilosum]
MEVLKQLPDYARPIEGLADVRALKRHLQGLHGFSRFRQTLICDGRSLDDDERLLSPADLQLVLLPFGPADAEQVNALIAAARGGCASDVEEMLRRPQDPNLVERTIFGLPGFDTPLLAAVEVGDIEKTRLLLEAGAAVTEEVLEAASLDLKLLDLLLDYGRCLYQASAAGCAELVRRLLEAGADENYLHYEDNHLKFHCTTPRRKIAIATPLSIAAQRGHLEVVNILMSAGADIYEEASMGSPLYAACSMGHVDIARLLLQAGAENSSWGFAKETPLYVASLKGHVEVVGLLLECRANVHRGSSIDTPVYVAASRGHVETVRLLLKAGADKRPGRTSETPLGVAARKGHAEVTWLLRCHAVATSAWRLGRLVAWLTVAVTLVKVGRLFPCLLSIARNARWSRAPR